MVTSKVVLTVCHVHWLILWKQPLQKANRVLLFWEQPLHQRLKCSRNLILRRCCCSSSYRNNPSTFLVFVPVACHRSSSVTTPFTREISIIVGMNSSKSFLQRYYPISWKHATMTHQENIWEWAERRHAFAQYTTGQSCWILCSTTLKLPKLSKAQNNTI